MTFSSAHSTDRFVDHGLSMLTKLLEEGYTLAVLRILGNTLPQFFDHSKALVQNST